MEKMKAEPMWESGREGEGKQDKDPNSVIRRESRLTEVKLLIQGQMTTDWYN